jgi:hypothetical protein
LLKKCSGEIPSCHDDTLVGLTLNIICENTGFFFFSLDEIDFHILVFLKSTDFHALSQHFEKSQLASSCLSVCPQGTTRFPLDGF